MDPPPHFPFDRDTHEMKMDAAALSPDRLIELDSRYAEEIALKRDILAQDRRYYCHTPESTLPLQWKTLELLLPSMARHHPQAFALEIHGDRWTWTNRLLSTRATFTPGDPDTLPCPPLEWIGRQVQEDLLLMDERDDGEMVLVAGLLCFAAKWCLDDKIGLPLLNIHDPVPGFRKRVGRPADLMMRRLKPSRPVGRWNWSIAPTDRLNLSPATAHEWSPAGQGITPENAGERCHLRLERQTLSRLPDTRGILFTILTYRAPLATLEAEPEKLLRLYRVLQSLPPELAAYKGIAPYRDALMTYLEATSSEDWP
ncbi:MAG: DUF3445 domain-containing protein [Armatimonadetes bacterium]|nr:DUF3445 domain-containing protein [Armatimonadota bacterium]